MCGQIRLRLTVGLLASLSVVQLLTEFSGKHQCGPEMKAIVKSLRSIIIQKVSSNPLCWPAVEVSGRRVSPMGHKNMCVESHTITEKENSENNVVSLPRMQKQELVQLR